MRFDPSQFTIRAAGLLFTGLALVACDPKILLGEFGDSEGEQNSGDSEGQSGGGTEGQSSGGTQGQSSGGETSGGSTEPETSGGGSTEPETSGGSTTGDTTGGDTGEPECDAWLQDCPTGQKCAPYTEGNDGPSFNAWRCVDVDATPESVGSTCHLTGPFASGEDDCELGAVCWDAHPDTLEGTCIALCEGSPMSPSCAAGTHCTELNDGDLNLCFDDCDLLAQDCGTEQVCIPDPGDPAAFICVLDASGAEGQAFDLCEYANACDPGLLCVDPQFVSSECSPMDIGCCTPFCDTSEPNTCPGVDQECLPWFAPNEAPVGKEDIGTCGIAP